MAIGTPIPSFTYFTPAMLAFGTGALSQLDRLIEPYEPHSILLVASGDYVDDLGITAAVKAAAQRVNPGLNDKMCVLFRRVEATSSGPACPAFPDSES